MARIILWLVFLLPFSYVEAQNQKINWLTIEKADSLYQLEPKPILIDFYTDWCGWCTRMDQTTYNNPTVITLVNRNFYPVKINAESADTLIFRNQQYLPLKNGKKYISSLAVELLGGKLSYPSTVFLHDNEKVNLVVPGYMDVVKMEAFLIYFTENAFRSTSINDFIGDFEKVFKPEEGVNKTGVPIPYWTPFAQLEEKRSTEPKKILLFMSASWNNTSKMMERVVFPDSVVSDIIQRYFYCLHLDIQSQDELTFMGHFFKNAGEENSGLHQLAIALSDKVVRIPSIYIFDEKGMLIERQYYYQGTGFMTRLLDFIGSDIYKSMSWPDYLKIKEIEGF